MEQSRKYLKIASILVLIFSGLTLINIIYELVFADFTDVEIPDGVPANILLITKIVIAVISVLLLLPRLYIGFKGLKIANNPDSSRGHIIWGMILLVISIIGVISPTIAIFKLESVLDNVMSLIGVLIDVVIFFVYVKSARELSRWI